MEFCEFCIFFFVFELITVKYLYQSYEINSFQRSLYGPDRSLIHFLVNIYNSKLIYCKYTFYNSHNNFCIMLCRNQRELFEKIITILNSCINFFSSKKVFQRDPLILYEIRSGKRPSKLGNKEFRNQNHK